MQRGVWFEGGGEVVRVLNLNRLDVQNLRVRPATERCVLGLELRNRTPRAY